MAPLGSRFETPTFESRCQYWRVASRTLDLQEMETVVSIQRAVHRNQPCLGETWDSVFGPL